MFGIIEKTVQHRNKARARAARQRRGGATMILVGACTVIIFGFAALAVDFGMLTVDKNRYQRAVDAAALAGAQELKDTTKARSLAQQVALQNGVTVPNTGISFLDDDTKIRVTAGNQRRFYFTGLLGFNSGGVNASAIAGMTGGTTTTTVPPAVVPIGITKSTVDAYTLPTLATSAIPLTTPRVVDEPYDLNKFILFDLRPTSAKSPTQMQSQLLNGYTETKVGDFNTSLNSSVNVINNNFVPPITERFRLSAEAPWHDTWTGSVTTSDGIRYNEMINGTARADNPRVMFLIVNNAATASGGTTNHEVLSFQPVYVESWKNETLFVRFLPPNFNGNSTFIGDSGVKTVSLIQ